MEKIPLIISHLENPIHFLKNKKNGLKDFKNGNLLIMLEKLQMEEIFGFLQK
jgi:hypothetical protein